MKKFFFSRTPSLFVSGGDVVMVVSKDAIKQANARLMGESAGVFVADDPYVRYQIPRPSKQEIEDAGARALRSLSAASAAG